MNCKREDLVLYAVTDRSWLDGETMAEQVEKALQGGVTFIQLREKNLSDTEFLAEAKEMKKICGRYGVKLIINDRADIAKESGADGVHLGQGDGSVQKARSILGADKVIGVSARTLEQALQAQADGADYLGSGAVFHTGTKNDAKPLDHKVLKQICETVDIPVVAIGGVSRDNVLDLTGSGVSGIAVVSAIFAQDDIGQAAQELVQLSLRMQGKEKEAK